MIPLAQRHQAAVGDAVGLYLLRGQVRQADYRTWSMPRCSATSRRPWPPIAPHSVSMRKGVV